MQSSILEWSRSTKRLVVVVMDIALALLAMWLAFSLRLDVLHRPVGAQWLLYALAPLLAIPIFARMGLYRAIFRYTGFAALTATAKAIGVYGLLLLAVLHWTPWPAVVIPRSVGILQPLIFLLLVGTSRAMARFWLAGQFGSRASRARGQLLIYGAGSAGVQTAAALRSGNHPYALAGFIDDDPQKVGRSINDLRVFAPAQLPALLARERVTDILLALPSTSRQRRNQIIASLQPLPVHIRTLPGLADLASGRVTVADFHELDIEDLLGREPVAPQSATLHRALAGKSILVTGAGGSIGSELCRQILREGPVRLVLVDHNEFGLYTIHRELDELRAQHTASTQLVPLLGNVRDATNMAAVLATHQPDTVYHAAAYKHVPLVEANPAEGIANNVLGTLTLARAAQAQGVARFVLVSTDKAVRPTSIMGASKRLAEMVLQALADQQIHEGKQGSQGTCFAMVRFGNVLGSSGSVVPLFRQQIAAGGPITVTHEDVTRYFMTIPEAAQLVLHAGAMAEGGEVFVLDMGQPVKIIDLARRMVALSGCTLRDAEHPEGDIEILITGLRPGEKLYEELLIGDNPVGTGHPRIMKAREEFLNWPVLAPLLDELSDASRHKNASVVLALLKRLVNAEALSERALFAAHLPKP